MKIVIRTNGLQVSLESVNGQEAPITRGHLGLTVKEFERIPEIDGLCLDKRRYSVYAVITCKIPDDVPSAHLRVLEGVKSLYDISDRLKKPGSYVTTYQI